ncbi:unnamed protein product, partial [Ixodes hexagonus]
GGTGASITGANAEIVGGEDAKPLEFPWQISLRFSQNTNVLGDHICGGSIINRQHIMTAAHCIIPNYTNSAYYKVVVGEQNLNKQDPTEKTFLVQNYTIHPQWDRATINYDYAILKLNAPLAFGGADNALMPICLPEKNQVFDNRICTASGWGYLKDESQGGGTVSEVLQKVDLPTLPYEQCRRDYKNVNKVVEDTMICAGTKQGGKSACQGDSGGPFQCPGADGRYVLAGTTSWGKTCGARNQPSVFARFSTRLDWIASVAGTTP